MNDDDLANDYDLMPLDTVDTVETMDDSNYSFHFFDNSIKSTANTTTTTTPTTQLPVLLLNQSITTATSLVTQIIPLLSDPEHSTVLQMTKTALTRLLDHYIVSSTEELVIEVPPTTGSRLRCARELKPDRNMTQNLRWKRSSDIHVSPNGSLAMWNSTINTIHWSSTKCHSRLHSGHYTIELELQQVKDAAHIRVGFLLEYIASNGRRHVDWGQDGVLGTSTTSWGIDVISSTKVMIELNLPRDAGGTAYFITPQHGRSASIPLPSGAVAIPACSMERKGQSVYITNITEHDDPQGKNTKRSRRRGGGGAIERRRTTSEISSSTLSTLSTLSTIENEDNKIKNTVQRQVIRICNALVRLQEYVNLNVAVDDKSQVWEKDPRKRRTLDHLITQLCTTIDPLKMTLHALYLSDKFGNEPDRQQQEEDRRTVRHGGGRNSSDGGGNSGGSSSGGNSGSSGEDNSKHKPVKLIQQESADLRDIIGDEDNIHYTEETLRVPSYQVYEDEEEDEVSMDDYANLFVCDGGGNLNLVDSIVSDEDGRQFWMKSFGTTTYQVAWEEFIRHLHVWLSGATDSVDDHHNSTTKSVLLTEDTLHNLKLTLDSCESGMINIYRYSALLEGFGPTLLTSVQKMSSTLKESWFHGFISFDETKEVLRGCQVGTFLVRFSESRPCCFSIACVVQSNSVSRYGMESSTSASSSTTNTTNTQVQQIIIEATKNQGYRTSNGTFYTSMAKVVHAYRDILKYPAPNTISRCRFFHGFLTYKETVHLLKNKIVGTYLMRFSKSQPGSLVLAYTSLKSSGSSSRSKQSKQSKRSSRSSSNVVVKQSLVYSSPQGYTIGEKLWPTLDALIYDNRNRLVEPCFAVEYEIPPESIEEQQQQKRSKTKEIEPKSEKRTTVHTHQSVPKDHGSVQQQSRSSLQRAWSAPTIDTHATNDGNDDIYNKMFPISPSDARVQQPSFSSQLLPSPIATGTARVGDALHGGVVTEADMNNFIVSGNYDLASQPPSSVVPVSNVSSSMPNSTGSSRGGSSKSSSSMPRTMNSQAAARLAAGLPPMSPVSKETTSFCRWDGPD